MRAHTPSPRVCVIGAGPAGLMAAEVLAQHGLPVDVYDAMPSVGRKFLLAGKGGLNLTHSEDSALFLTRYRERSGDLRPHLQAFGAQALRDWAAGLDIETFVGTSGRVFPQDMKAAPLLRAWLHRLRGQGVRFHMRHRWVGGSFDTAPQHLQFETAQGVQTATPAATVLALGGGSWARLGSDGAWVEPLRQLQVKVADLKSSNCGFEVQWSAYFRSRFEGAALKSVALQWIEADGSERYQRGEFIITAHGVEGSLIYAASAALRQAIDQTGQVCAHVDLLPHKTLEAVTQEVRRPKGPRSWSSHLKSRLGLEGVKAALLWEVLDREALQDPVAVAQTIKHLPLTLQRPRPLDEAISSAGGVCFEGLTPELMLQHLPGVFVAGEMLDWEAPTGGYLLTACMATGRAAGAAAARYCQRRSSPDETGTLSGAGCNSS